jgi:tetratricopeptide (TPR) repeat protein
MGWCWYLGMLLPVIGLVQVGWQAGADRYTYWPAIGLVAAAVLAAIRWLQQCPRWKAPVLATGILAVLTYLGLTSIQLPYWRNAETLGTRAIEVTKTNIIAHQIRGKFYYDQGRRNEALLEFRQALQIGEQHSPTAALASNNMAFRLVLAADFQKQGQLTEALAEYERILPQMPGSAPAHNDLGNLLADMGRKDEALVHYRAAIKLSPRSVESYNNMAITLAELGRFPEALAAHAQAAELAPEVARTHYLTGKTYWRMGRPADAITSFRRALAVAPQDYQSLTLLARILASTPEPTLRDGAEAVRLAQQAAQLTGQQQPLVLDVLAMAQAEQGNFPAAQQTITQALTLATAAQATNLLTELQRHATSFAARQPWRHTNTPPQAQP